MLKATKPSRFYDYKGAEDNDEGDDVTLANTDKIAKKKMKMDNIKENIEKKKNTTRSDFLIKKKKDEDKVERNPDMKQLNKVIKKKENVKESNIADTIVNKLINRPLEIMLKLVP